MNREFTPNADKTTVLCGDTTYLKVNGIWCYLAVVINLCNRQVVGWKLSRHHDSDLVVDALHHAMLNVKKTAKMISIQTKAAFMVARYSAKRCKTMV